MGAIGQPDMVQCRERFLAAARLRAGGVERAEDGADGFLTGLALDCDHDVVERREVGEEPEVLEGAGDAGMHDRLRAQAVELLASEGDCAFVRVEETGDDVEDRGLARAVGSNEAGDAALLDGEAAVLECAQSTEAVVKAGHL